MENRVQFEYLSSTSRRIWILWPFMAPPLRNNLPFFKDPKSPLTPSHTTQHCIANIENVSSPPPPPALPPFKQTFHLKSYTCESQKFCIYERIVVLSGWTSCRIWNMTENLTNGYSSENTQQELSNEYQHDRVKVVIVKMFAFLCFGRN